MTNGMIALVSNWEEKLRSPKCDKKDDPRVWATSFPHLITRTEREKSLNQKAVISNQRPTIIEQIRTNYKHLAFSKTREHVKGVSAPCALCALCGQQCETQQIDGAMCFTSNEQN